MMKQERVEIMHQVSVPADKIRSGHHGFYLLNILNIHIILQFFAYFLDYIILQRPMSDRIDVVIESSLLPNISSNISQNFSSNSLTVWLESWVVDERVEKIPSSKDALDVKVV